MRTSSIRAALFAVCALLVAPEPAEAFGRRQTAYYPTSVCCYQAPHYWCPPCYPSHWCWPHDCWPPHEKPLDPLPPHPTPHTLLDHKLTLHNGSYSDAFVNIYIRHPDGVYREYERLAVAAGTDVSVAQKYYAADHLLIYTWTRSTPGHWRCRCNHLVTLSGGSGKFDVVHCGYTTP